MPNWLERLLSHVAPARSPPDGDAYEAHREKGTLLARIDDFDEAIGCFERALALRPELAEAHFNLAVAYRGAGKPERALACLERALQRAPDFAPALCEAGWIERQLGRREQAVSRLQRAVEIDPRLPDAQYQLGELMLELGEPERAQACFRAAVAERPEHAEALTRLAALRRGQRDLAEALSLLEGVVRSHPERADAHLMLGSIHLERGEPGRAEACLRSAIALRCDFAEAHSDLGLALFSQGRFREAEACCREALRLKPDLAAAFVNLGLVLEHGMGDGPAAIASFREALRLQAGHVEALAGLGTAYQAQGLLDDASACFARALALAPENPVVNMAQAALALLQGDFGSGWPKYEWRRQQAEEIHRRFGFAQWDGSSLAGRTILLYAEQGIGDQIMFASCIPEVLAQARGCVIECSGKLGAIFRRSFPGAIVHAGTEEDPAAWLAGTPPIDVQLPLGSLPLYLRRSPADFPGHPRYLRADGGKVRAWRARLDALGPGLKVGLSWRGGMPMSGRARRSIDLERLLPILRTPGAHFVDLQYTDCSEESASLERRHAIRLARWAQAIDDYDETAALVCALDLTLSVCTALVHLGGALGRPVWAMAPFSPEWRYGLRGETIPWYPSVRMFRQPAYGDWQSVVEEVARRLAQLTCAPPRSG